MFRETLRDRKLWPRFAISVRCRLRYKSFSSRRKSRKNFLVVCIVVARKQSDDRRRSTSYGARMREYSYYQARRAEREKFVAVQCTRARFNRRIRWLTRNGINRLILLLFSFERATKLIFCFRNKLYGIYKDFSIN